MQRVKRKNQKSIAKKTLSVSHFMICAQRASQLTNQIDGSVDIAAPHSTAHHVYVRVADLKSTLSMILNRIF